MKEKKEITLGTAIATSIGAILWIVVAFFHRQLLANTTALILMIAFSVSWSLDAILKIVKYLKQKKEVE